MKINKLIKFFLTFILINNVFIQGARDINSPDYNQYISGILKMRSEDVAKSMNDMTNILNPPTKDMFPAITLINSLSAAFGILGAFVPGMGVIGGAGCGITALLSSAVLGVVDDAINSNEIKLTQGIQSMIGASIDEYQARNLQSYISGAQKLINNFIENNMGKYGNINPNDDYVSNINFGFIKDVYHFGYVDIKAGSPLQSSSTSSIALFTIYANTHLLFLSDIIKNYDFYKLSISKDTFISNFKEYSVSYRLYINSVEEKGRAALMIKIENDGVKNQDKWNAINEYENYFHTYCYDFANYWFAMDTTLYPTGMMIENARISISNILGSAFDTSDDPQLNYDKIVSLFDTINMQYQGSLKDIKTRLTKPKLAENYHVVKYLSTVNYNSDTGNETYRFSAGSNSGDTTEYETSYEAKSITAEISNKIETVNWRDYRECYHRDAGGQGMHHGHVYDVTFFIGSEYFGSNQNKVDPFSEKRYSEGSFSFLGKVLNIIIPTTYHGSHLMYFKELKAFQTTEVSVKTVEGYLFGFVGRDIKDENIIIDGTSSMVDAQKFFTTSGPISQVNKKDSILKYTGGIKIERNTRLVYKLTFKSMDGTPQKFRLQGKFISPDYKPVRFTTFISYGNEQGCLNYIGDNTIYPTGGFFYNDLQVSDIEKSITLYPNVENYLIVDINTYPMVLSSLIFVNI